MPHDFHPDKRNVYRILTIDDNDALTSLRGLDGLLSVQGNFLVRSNDDLISLAGLEGLSTVGRDLYFMDNLALCADEVDDLVTQLIKYNGTTKNTNNYGLCLGR